MAQVLKPTSCTLTPEYGQLINVIQHVNIDKTWSTWQIQKQVENRKWSQQKTRTREPVALFCSIAFHEIDWIPPLNPNTTKSTNSKELKQELAG